MIIDGRKIASEITDSVKKELEDGGLKPGIATVLVGDDAASELYVNLKLKACRAVGIHGELHKMPETSGESEIISLIDELNDREDIHGILVQLPLPRHINTYSVLNKIDSRKDVDGLHSMTIGEVTKGNERMASCTPKAVIHMLEKSGIDVEGKEVVIVGASIEVGKPLAIMLLNRHATVSVCHIKTKYLDSYTRKADIVISCTGVARLIKGDMIKKGAVVIDVGISKVDGKVQGDVDMESVKDRASHISPVPGGVGPVTVAMLLRNTLNACSAIENRN